MDIPVATVVQAPKGYRSEEARSRFMLRAALMAVAFTENWQRLGDMAAKAIVVEVRPGRG